MVLDEGAEEGARAPGRGVLGEHPLRLVSRDSAPKAADLDVSVLDPEGPTLSLHHDEEVEEAGAHGHLLVIAGREQAGADLPGEARRRRLLANLARQDGHGQRLDRRIGGVEDDEVGEERRDEPREGAGQGRPGVVAGREQVQHRLAVLALGQVALQLGDQLRRRLVQDDLGRWLCRRLAPRLVSQGAQPAALVEDRGGAHLREVVVVGGHPEDRDHPRLHLVLERGGDLASRHGLVENEERAPEQARLLPGDDHGRRGIGQRAGALAGAGRPPRGLLRGQRLRQGARRVRIVPRAGRGAGDGLLVPVAGVVEPGRGGAAFEVVAEEGVGGLLERPVRQDRSGTLRHCAAIIGGHSWMLTPLPRHLFRGIACKPFLFCDLRGPRVDTFLPWC